MNSPDALTREIAARCGSIEVVEAARGRRRAADLDPGFDPVGGRTLTNSRTPVHARILAATTRQMAHDLVRRRNAAIRAAVIDGQALRGIAAAFGLTCPQVRETLRVESRAWAAYRAHRPREKSAKMRERNAAIRRAMIEDGRTLQSVAHDHGVSRQRVFQVIRGCPDSWRAYQQQRKERRRDAAIRAAVIDGQATRRLAVIYGLTCFQLREILRADSRAWAAYRAQRPRGKSAEMRERDAAIRRAVIEDGRSLQSVAHDHDVSRQRVFQVVRSCPDTWRAYQEKRQAKFQGRPLPGKPEQVPCAGCGHPFERTRATASRRFCSKSCGDRSRRNTTGRARRGYAMRRSGMTWREIAETLDLATNERGQHNLGHVCSMVRRYAERNNLSWPATSRLQ